MYAPPPTWQLSHERPTECCFDWLAEELILHILSFLPHYPRPSRTVMLLPAVCRHWAWLARDRSLSPANLALADLLDGAEALRESRLGGRGAWLAQQKGSKVDQLVAQQPLRWSVTALLCGPRCSGKSTLAGLLLYLYGATTQQELDATQQQLDMYSAYVDLSKGNPYATREGTRRKCNIYSASLDRARDERSHGRSLHGHTRQVTVWPRCTLTLMDVPGSYELPKPFMSSSFGAHCAIIVVDAVKILLPHVSSTEEELSHTYKYFDTGPLQRVADQLAVLRTYNVKRLIFLVNKMDKVGFSQDTFEKVCAELLLLVGVLAKNFAPWQQNNLTFIPSSYKDLTSLFGSKDRAALAASEEMEFVLPASSPYYTRKQKTETKGNYLSLLFPFARLSWYKGPNLLQALRQVFDMRINTAPTDLVRKAEQPLRFCIDKVYNAFEVTATGFVETGILRKGTKLFIWPLRELVGRLRVASIFHNRREVDTAYPGQWVSIRIRTDQPPTYRWDRVLTRGMVAVEANKTKPSQRQVDEIMATISLTAPLKLEASVMPVMYCGTRVVPVRVVEVISKLDKLGKEVPGTVNLKGHNALVKLKPMKPLFCEPYVPTLTAASAHEGEKAAAASSSSSKKGGQKAGKRFNALGRFVLRDNHVTFAVGSVQSVTYS